MNIFDLILPKASKQCITLANGQKLGIDVVSNANSKNIRMRFSKTFDKIIVSKPIYVSAKSAILFVELNRNWVEENIKCAPKQIDINIGAIIPLFNKPTLLKIINQKEQYYLKNDILYIPSSIFNFKEKTRVILKKMALEKINQHITEFSPLLEVLPNKVRISDAKTRWGSCSSKRDITVSWRLIFAPPEVLKEVVAHELAHLTEMNHSKRFYAELKRLMPEYIKDNEWLEINGRNLHLIN